MTSRSIRVLARLAKHRLPTLAALTLTGVALASCQTANSVPQRLPAAGWHLGWRAETVFPTVSSTPTSCRFSAMVTSSGTALRAEFTGLANTRGYSILGASVARPAAPNSLTVTPGSSVPLTFGGKPGVTVHPGNVVLSDPIPFVTTDNKQVLITVSASAGDSYLKGELSEPGGCSASSVVPSAANAPAGAFAAKPGYVRWLRSLLVEGMPQRSIAALGDSITEGPAPRTVGDMPRWTDVLAQDGSNVVNAGVGGNALTRTGMFGTVNGESRAAALLAEPNLTDLVLCMGTNDLAFGASSQQILDAMARVISSAQRVGVRVWVCTIPARNSPTWPTRLENERQQVNNAVRGTWLRSRGANGIDMDVAVRDPLHPKSLRPAYDSGDHLHPNAAGARAMGLRAVSIMGLPSAPPASPAPTPATPTPATPTPTTPAPTPTTPAPTSPAPTTAAPTSPAPTSPAPTSPDPTSPAPTSPDPTSTDSTGIGPAASDPTATETALKALVVNPLW